MHKALANAAEEGQNVADLRVSQFIAKVGNEHLGFYLIFRNICWV